VTRPTVVYTAGVFDMLHRGHLNFLHASKALGDILVVGVVSDAGCKAYKNLWPTDNVQRRMKQIMALDCVDVVVYQATTNPTENLRRFLPDIMTHGDDWDRLREGHGDMEALGVQWVTLPYTQGISSTQLRG
jgi:rfaE bifunctional protein nucleotidyltransferase chain/domain